VKKQQIHSVLQTIGIMGIDAGNGVTHLAIMMGNYITAKLHKNTGILEMNNTGAFLELKESYGENTNKNQEDNHFKIADVTYYYGIGNNRIGEVYSKGYEYIIIDMGTYNEKKTEEFLKCSIKILIGNLNPWNNKKFISTIESFIAHGKVEKMKYLVQFKEDDMMHQFEKVYQINMYIMPYEPDPFLIHGCNFGFLEHLLQ
jgi:hypothetical protein